MVGCHANHFLQLDFSASGANDFEIKTLQSGVLPIELAASEANYISKLLDSGHSLYNLTRDGQGSRHRPFGPSHSETISEIRKRQDKFAEQQQLSEIYYRDREGIFYSYEEKLKVLLPRNWLWSYLAEFFGSKGFAEKKELYRKLVAQRDAEIAALDRQQQIA